MEPRALLLGMQGKLPFNGYFRFQVVGAKAVLHGAGAVMTEGSPARAYAAAMDTRDALSAASGRTRHDLLRSAWSLLASMDRVLLGDRRGADLALLLVAEDETGTGICGTGLQGLFGAWGDRLESLAPPGHPLFSLQGIPDAPPRVLTPSRIPPVTVAAPRGAALSPEDGGTGTPPGGGQVTWNAAAAWRLRCGLREG